MSASVKPLGHRTPLAQALEVLLDPFMQQPGRVEVASGVMRILAEA
jgi:hypothetical protein